MSTAIRNRAIKKALEQAFGRGKVSVTGSRGTAYGWVNADIAYAPRDWSELDALRSQVRLLAGAAARSVGERMDGYYSDDYSDNTERMSMIIDFLPCRDRISP